MFQCSRPLENCITSDNKNSLFQLILYNFGNATLREQSLYHSSSQNFTLGPSRTSNQRNLEKSSQPLLMDFYTLTPSVPNTGLVHQPLPPSPYFASITFLQRASLSIPYIHNHLPNKVELNCLSRQIPKPLFCIGIQTLAHSTRGIL